VLLFDLSRTHPKRKVYFREMVIAFIIATCMGALMEVLQGIATSSRSADWWDMAANSGGAITGTLIGMVTLPVIFSVLFRKSKRKN
ncbi:MAG: hypothetical protein RR346_10830, partial [Bacteroidales bacterium]